MPEHRDRSEAKPIVAGGAAEPAATSALDGGRPPAPVRDARAPSDAGVPDSELACWNDAMYRAHATPYEGFAGRIQRARVAAILRLADIRAGDAVLEIGCEAGRLMAAVPRCRRLVGVDVSSAALADARALLSGRAGVELVQLDAQRQLPFRPGELDVVICSEMLEHVSAPRAVIERIAEIAAAETRIVISVPVEAPKLAVKRLLSALGVFERLFPGVETGQSEWHLHAFSRNALLDCARGLLHLERGAYVWGCHYVARFRKA